MDPVKPGDLALWVTRGVLVDVISVSYNDEIYVSQTGHSVQIYGGGFGFRCRMVGAPQHQTGQRHLGLFRELAILASGLKPIRDTPGEDETLQWLPVPSKSLSTV